MRISRWDGILLLILYGIYMAVLLGRPDTPPPG
jgi:hypothetical protein